MVSFYTIYYLLIIFTIPWFLPISFRYFLQIYSDVFWGNVIINFLSIVYHLKYFWYIYSNLKKLELTNYQEETDDYFTDIAKKDNTYIISGYSTYEENDYISKLITYTTSGKLIGEE